MKRLLLSITLPIAAVFFASCNSETTEQQTTSESKSFEVVDVDSDAAKELIESGDVAVLDVRSQAEWDAGHIANAVHVPIADPEFEAKMAELDYSKPFVVH